MNNYYYEPTHTPNKEVLNEWSTEEKSKFAYRMNDLKKSFIHNPNLNSLSHNPSIKTIAYNSISNDEETAKISYKFMTRTQVETENKIKIMTLPEENSEEKYFWFAAYDKLIKTNKINKIINFYKEKEKVKGDNSFLPKENIVNNFII